MAEKEYIEREAAIDALTERNLVVHMDSVNDGLVASCHRSAQRIIANIPAADVRPVEKCKWENLVRCGFASVEATCSACGITLIYKPWWHFCPNCGARVEKEQEDK